MKKKDSINGKNFAFSAQMEEAVNYVKSSVNYVYFIVIVFFLSFLLGFIFSGNFRFLDVFLRELISKTIDLNWMELFLFIFQNNLQSAFFGLFLGIFFGIFPIINTLTNGVVLGYVSSKVADEVSIFELWRIFPHGIFELPAIFISLGLGLKLGLSVFSHKKGEFKYRIYNSANSFLFVVLPLLLIAAIIESLLIFVW